MCCLRSWEHFSMHLCPQPDEPSDQGKAISQWNWVSLHDLTSASKMSTERA
jgi:hypothetical protein